MRKSLRFFGAVLLVAGAAGLTELVGVVPVGDWSSDADDSFVLSWVRLRYEPNATSASSVAHAYLAADELDDRERAAVGAWATARLPLAMNTAKRYGDRLFVPFGSTSAEISQFTPGGCCAYGIRVVDRRGGVGGSDATLDLDAILSPLFLARFGRAVPHGQTHTLHVGAAPDGSGETWLYLNAQYRHPTFYANINAIVVYSLEVTSRVTVCGAEADSCTEIQRTRNSWCMSLKDLSVQQLILITPLCPFASLRASGMRAS